MLACVMKEFLIIVDIVDNCRLHSQILGFLYSSIFVVKENHVFNEEDNPSQKFAIVEGELDDIEIDETGNLKDLPRLGFID